MSQESVAKFVEAINASPQLLNECRQTFGNPDPSGFVTFARMNEFELTAEEVVSLFRALSAESRELGEEDLALVSGGGARAGDPFQLSAMLLVRTIGMTPVWARSNPVGLTPIQLP